MKFVNSFVQLICHKQSNFKNYLLENNVFIETVKDNLYEVAALLNSSGNEWKQNKDSESDENEKEFADSAENGSETDREGVEVVHSTEWTQIR